MGVKFKEVKQNDTSRNGFNETTAYKVLHCGNVEGNNNKFYCIELQHKKSSGEYRLFTHYGRLLTSQVFGVRGPGDKHELEVEMGRIVKKKLTGKKIKENGETRVEKYEEIDTVAPTIGSENIRGKTIQTKSVKGVDTSDIKNKKIIRIIDQVVEENVHNIQNLTTLKLTVNGFETPLGPVTKPHVQKARNALDIMNALLVNDVLDKMEEAVRSANNKYYSLIPHQFGRKITEDDWILTSEKLVEEYDLLEQLESAVTMGAALKQGASKKLSALGIEIEELPKGAEYRRIEEKVYSTRGTNHTHMNVYNYGVKNIFTMKIPNERQTFEKIVKQLGNKKELFHGSRNCNILSIMKNGFMIPPCNAPHVTGRMFGAGVYAAKHSTKALNYSTGWWKNSDNRYDNCFMFLVNFAMGKIYETQTQLYSGVPSGYNSIWAKPGRSLQNDEFIIKQVNQSTITHLVEMNT